MRRIIFYVLLLAGLAFLVINFGRSLGDKKVLARIGKDRITVGDFNGRIRNLPDRYQAVIRKKQKEFLQEIINDVLLYQEALRQKLDKDTDVIKVVEEARKKILIARLLKDKIDDVVVVSDEEILERYGSDSEKYMVPEVMRVSHILVQRQEDAAAVIEELKTGTPFDEAARMKSVDPTAQNGGDIGYFPKGQLIPEFENACSNLEVGEISGPVKTKLGYHIIKLTDRKEPALRPLADVKEKIRATLYTEKRREEFNDLLGKLKKTTKIEIDENALEGAKGRGKNDENKKSL